MHENRELDAEYERAMGRCPHPLKGAEVKLGARMCPDCAMGFVDMDGMGVFDEYGAPQYHRDWRECWKIVEVMTALEGYDRMDYFWEGPVFKPENRYLTEEGYPLGTTCWYVYVELNGLRKWFCHDDARIAVLKAGIYVANNLKSDPNDPRQWETVSTRTLDLRLCASETIYFLPLTITISKFNGKVHPDDAKKCGMITDVRIPRK